MAGAPSNPVRQSNHTIFSSSSWYIFVCIFSHGRLYHLDDGPSKGGWGAARSGQGNATYWLLAVYQGINTTGGGSETAQKAILETDPKCPITTLEEQEKDNEKKEKLVYSEIRTIEKINPHRRWELEKTFLKTLLNTIRWNATRSKVNDHSQTQSQMIKQKHLT